MLWIGVLFVVSAIGTGLATNVYFFVIARFIGGRPYTREEVWARILRYVGHWTLKGYGFWAIEEKLSGDFIGEAGHLYSSAEGAHDLHEREPHPGLAPHPKLPDDTRLWAALQQASGGTWGGCVYDVDAIISRLQG